MDRPGAFAQRLETGPGMRVQRGAEAAFLLAAFALGDVRLVYVTFALTALQALSPWLAPIALLVTAVHHPRKPKVLGDLYFDLAGSRGACILSALVQALGLVLLHEGLELAGWIALAIPTASFTLSPTVGFCAGCTFYVWIRDLLVRLGLRKGAVDGIRDFDIEETVARRQ